jgi:transposase
MTENVRKRRSFPDPFKLKAIAAVRGGRTVAQVAAELGLPDRLMRAWLRWAETRSSDGPRALGSTRHNGHAVAPRRVEPSPADQAAEIAQLRRELDRVWMEHDILKGSASRCVLV